MGELNESKMNTQISNQQIDPKDNILLVEDDEVATNVVMTFLRGAYNLECVTDGEQALEKINAKKYDLILMDINLGSGMNGLHVTKLIREIPHYMGVPIIALTAYAMEGDSEEFLAAGCSHYLAKPFGRQELVDMVKSALKKT